MVMGPENNRDSRENFQNVTCAYCGQTMGWYRSENIGSQEKEVDFEDNSDLTPTCSKSPNGEHTNMTVEQAKESGLI